MLSAIGHQAGKLSEVLLRILQQFLTGTFVPLSQNLSNFKGECEKLEQTPKTAGPEGLRLVMPRAMVFLYTLRNKRDFGHAGGEVDANEIDAFTAVRMADWCLCELYMFVIRSLWKMLKYFVMRLLKENCRSYGTYWGKNEF